MARVSRNKLIWCEVSCGRCGRAANNCGYYSPELIKRLKAETITWEHDDDYRVLCPMCKIAVECERTAQAAHEVAVKKQAIIDKERKKVEESLEDCLY